MSHFLLLEDRVAVAGCPYAEAFLLSILTFLASAKPCEQNNDQAKHEFLHDPKVKIFAPSEMNWEPAEISFGSER
jgi:hypothetical protein